jgi:hypothetical protein
MRPAGKLLSWSVFHTELGHAGIKSHSKALNGTIDIARLPTSKSTLPTYEKGNLAMSKPSLIL